MKILLYFVIIPGFLSSIKAQTIDLSNWRIDSLPVAERYQQAENSKDNWILKKEGGKISIVKNGFEKYKGDALPVKLVFPKEMTGNRMGIIITKKIKNGFLVSNNNGEFGGELWFLSSNGKQWSLLGNNLSIEHIFTFNSHIYAICGTGMVGPGSGKIIEIYFDKKWKQRILTDAKRAFLLAFPRQNDVIILARDAIINMDKENNIRELLKTPFFLGSLYPSAMEIIKESIYISMRGGVLQIQNFEKDPVYKWFIPVKK